MKLLYTLLFVVLFVSCGAFCIWGAASDNDFFMNSRKARRWVAIVGRNGARIFYIILGVFIIVLGLAVGIKGF